MARWSNHNNGLSTVLSTSFRLLKGRRANHSPHHYFINFFIDVLFFPLPDHRCRDRDCTYTSRVLYLSARGARIYFVVTAATKRACRSMRTTSFSVAVICPISVCRWQRFQIQTLYSLRFHQIEWFLIHGHCCLGKS